MPLAVYSKTPKKVSGNFDKKQRLSSPELVPKEQSSRKQDAKENTGLFCFWRWRWGYQSQCGRQRRGGSCRYGRRGLGRGAITSCFVILPRFPWRPLLLSAVIRPANRTNLMHHRERNASSDARQSSPAFRGYRRVVKSSQTETVGEQRGRASPSRAPSSCTSALKPSLSLHQTRTSEIGRPTS